MTLRLESARLIIRTFEPRDAETWLAMVNEPEFNRYLPPGPDATMETFLGSIERRHTMERERGFAVWAVDLKETGAFVGQCGFVPAEGKGPEIELVYHFNKAAWNKGYGTEAAATVLAHAFGALRLDHVVAFVMPGNVGSCRVAEKAGMRFDRIVSVYELENIRKYIAERSWWTAPPQT